MSLSDYESTLKSYIHDDDKLVTYKWLSKELEVHVNVAKDVLKQFWEKYRCKGDVVATYLLIGQLKDASIRVEVAKESDLSAAKEKFTKVDCEHLYSLQKCLPDIELLALAGDGDLRYSAIKCNEEFIRDEDEIDGLRYIGNVNKNEGKSEGSSKANNKVTDKPAPKAASKGSDKLAPKKNELFQNKKSEKSEDKKDESKEKPKKEKEEPETPKPEAKTAAPVKKVSPPGKAASGKAGKKPLQSKQTGFNNLFGKAQSKPVSTETKKVSSNDEKDKASLNSVNKNTETPKDKKEEQKKEEQKKVQEKENSKNNQEKDDKKPTSGDKIKSTNKSDSKGDSKAKSKDNANSKKRQRSQEKNTASKRKRILVIDSSEDEKSKSEDEVEEPMEVEEEPPKPVRKRSPSPPAEKRENGKRMVRKTVDKTYKDEDGYLVTKTEYVYELAQDDDKADPAPPPPPKSKPVDSKAKKQTTLMNFFKKS